MTEVEKISIAKKFISAHKPFYIGLFLEDRGAAEFGGDDYFLHIYGCMLNGKFGEVILHHEPEGGTTYVMPIESLHHRKDLDVLFSWREGGDGLKKVHNRGS